MPVVALEGNTTMTPIENDHADVLSREGTLPCSIQQKTATGLALHCVGMPPPMPDKKSAYRGGNKLCCICAGDASSYGVPFRRDKAISDTFMRPDDMEWEASDAVCAACVFFTTPSTFHGCVERRLPNVKLWPQASWRSYSHLFADGTHRVMKPTDWRAFFMLPPPPPFVAVVSLTGKKNILHRARVAQNSVRFPVQLEEESTWVEAREVRESIGLVEEALAAGWSRDEVLAGACKQSTALQMGITAWRVLKERIEATAQRHKASMQLATLAAHRPATEAVHA